MVKLEENLGNGQNPPICWIERNDQNYNASILDGF